MFFGPLKVPTCTCCTIVKLSGRTQNVLGGNSLLPPSCHHNADPFNIKNVVRVK